MSDGRPNSLDDDEVRFPYPFTERAYCEVRVSRTAMLQGESWVKDRIEGWFRYHDRPIPGTSIRIPDYQFDSNLFQPGGTGNRRP